MTINLLECPSPATPRPSVTKTVTWQYLRDQAWYHRSIKKIPIFQKCPIFKNALFFKKNAPFSKKCPIFKKYFIFTGPDLKQARRTGLSARRARRKKSRGPKGLQLEVGARRAPRLLSLIWVKIKVWFQKRCLWERTKRCTASIVLPAPSQPRRAAIPRNYEVARMLVRDASAEFLRRR